MVYARGEYRVVDRARGAEKAKTVTVEFSCIDMESPSGKDDIGHCPGGEGVVLHGFEESPDGFSAGQEPIPLFLSRPSSSPLDGADVYGDVTFRPFSSCVDGPRDFESGDGEWQYVKKAEAEHRPSSPVAEVTKKAAEKKKLKREKSGCG